MADYINKNAVLVVNDGNYPLLVDLIPVLLRVGLEIDLVSSGKILRRSKFIRRFYFEKDKYLMPALLKKLTEKIEYSLVVITTDSLLKIISSADLDEKTKLKLLPVMNADDISSLYSKVELSKKFSQINIQTPAFEVLESRPIENTYKTNLKFPLMVKIDSSGAGLGVFECAIQSDLWKTLEKINIYPVLIQEKMDGDTLDASAIFLKGDLIYFTLSKIEKEMYQFGPSSLRTYYGAEKYNAKVISELKLIGNELKIHGFTNISLINSNNENYYFEVDVRPNAWINHGYFIGHDCANILRMSLIEGNEEYRDASLIPNVKQDVLMPHYLRISLFDLMINMNKVWSFIPKYGWYYIYYRQIKMLKKKMKKNAYSFYPYNESNSSPYGKY